jgi:ABC-type sugar transport system substrate-binding protein
MTFKTTLTLTACAALVCVAGNASAAEDVIGLITKKETNPLLREDEGRR